MLNIVEKRLVAFSIHPGNVLDIGIVGPAGVPDLLKHDTSML